MACVLSLVLLPVLALPRASLRSRGRLAGRFGRREIQPRFACSKRRLGFETFSPKLVLKERVVVRLQAFCRASSLQRAND